MSHRPKIGEEKGRVIECWWCGGERRAIETHSRDREWKLQGIDWICKWAIGQGWQTTAATMRQEANCQTTTALSAMSGRRRRLLAHGCVPF